jgi:hypothetical protein
MDVVSAFQLSPMSAPTFGFIPDLRRRLMSSLKKHLEIKHIKKSREQAQHSPSIVALFLVCIVSN